jgi:chromosome segregation ATPase
MTVDYNTPIVLCPKCGYRQEERLDCMKCGIVFSKYLALRSSGKAPQPEGFEDNALRMAEESAVMDLNEPRQSLAELQRLGNAIEFERLERSRMSSDVKQLERKLSAHYEDLAARMSGLEMQAPAAPPVPQSAAPDDLAEFKRDLLELHFEPLARRLDEIEQRIDSAPKEPATRTDPRILEVLRRFEVRVTELEAKASRLSSDGNGGRDLYANLERVLGEANHQLAELRQSLTQVRDDQAAGMAAVRAELETQAQKDTEEGSHRARRLDELTEDLKRVNLRCESFSEGIAQIEDRTRGVLAQNPLLEDKIEALRSEAQTWRQEVGQIREILEELSTPQPEEPRPLLDEEVHAIRENFDQLLHYIGSLAKKS